MKNVVFVTSKKDDGNMSPKSENFQENFEKFATSQNISTQCYISMNQTHSANVVSKMGVTTHEKVAGCDSVVTNSGVTLSILTADCLPIIFFDKSNELIAAVHAGYKGILQGIVEKTITELLEQGASIPSLHLKIGPSIGVCCYDVDQERIDQFTQMFGDLKDALEIRNKKNFLSLQKIAEKEAIRLGITSKNITIQDVCTKCSGQYFSYRSDNKMHGTTEVSGLNITLARLQ